MSVDGHGNSGIVEKFTGAIHITPVLFRIGDMVVSLDTLENRMTKRTRLYSHADAVDIRMEYKLPSTGCDSSAECTDWHCDDAYSKRFRGHSELIGIHRVCRLPKAHERWSVRYNVSTANRCITFALLFLGLMYVD